VHVEWSPPARRFPSSSPPSAPLQLGLGHGQLVFQIPPSSGDSVVPLCFHVIPGLLSAWRLVCWRLWVPAPLCGLTWVIGYHLGSFLCLVLVLPAQGTCVDFPSLSREAPSHLFVTSFRRSVSSAHTNRASLRGASGSASHPTSALQDDPQVWISGEPVLRPCEICLDNAAVP